MKTIWGETIWWAVYGVFRRNKCLYVGSTQDPFYREQCQKRRFGRGSEFRVLKWALSEPRAALFEHRLIRKYKKLGQAKFNKNGRIV